VPLPVLPVEPVTINGVPSAGPDQGTAQGQQNGGGVSGQGGAAGP
jgi:hypothetical protein